MKSLQIRSVILLIFSTIIEGVCLSVYFGMFAYYGCGNDPEDADTDGDNAGPSDPFDPTNEVELDIHYGHVIARSRTLVCAPYTGQMKIFSWSQKGFRDISSDFKDVGDSI